jgi:TonB family protein
MRLILYVICLLTALAPAQQTKLEEPIYKIGKDVKLPRAISSPRPDFSAYTRRRRLDGVVVVSGYVGTDGNYHDPKILRSIGDSELDEKVLDAVKKWTFNPCTRNDKPVNCRMNLSIEVHYHREKGSTPSLSSRPANIIP